MSKRHRNLILGILIVVLLGMALWSAIGDRFTTGASNDVTTVPRVGARLAVLGPSMPTYYTMLENMGRYSISISGYTSADKAMDFCKSLSLNFDGAHVFDSEHEAYIRECSRNNENIISSFAAGDIWGWGKAAGIGNVDFSFRRADGRYTVLIWN